jgi:hypothetical protein
MCRNGGDESRGTVRSIGTETTVAGSGGGEVLDVERHHQSVSSTVPSFRLNYTISVDQLNFRFWFCGQIEQFQRTAKELLNLFRANSIVSSVRNVLVYSD